MDNSVIPSDKKQFTCCHCNGSVVVPLNLPPTTAPCPYCGGTITSPGNDQQTPTRVANHTAASTPPPPPPVPAYLGELGHHPAHAPRSRPAPAAPAEQPAAKKPEQKAVPKVAPAPASQPKPATRAPAKGSRTSARPRLLSVLSILLLCILIGGILAFFITREMRGKDAPPATASSNAGQLAQEANYLRVGWQKDASDVLEKFLNARTSAEKLPQIIGGESMAARLKEIYGASAIDDSDTPASSFSFYELSEEDRKRGLFMMVHDQPPQFEMGEFFRPLATLEVQHGLAEADLLLSTMARAANFAMEPLRVHAFFKRTPDGLKLDWEIFAQTKYRTLLHFVELPEPGRTGVFRVFIVEDVPHHEPSAEGVRTYRISDPANINDSARITVKEDSEVGIALSQINWRGTKESRPLTRTATLELSWSEDVNMPQLQIKRFICWEFLGLGGQDSKPSSSNH